MVKADSGGALVVEIDTPRNASWLFPPMQKNIRGRFDVLRISEPNAMKLRQEYPEAIPGQRLAVDLAGGECCVIEPLHDPEYAELRQKLAKRYTIAPGREVVSGADVATWLYWIGKAIDGGIAKVISGKMPSTLPGEPQNVDNLFGMRQKSPQEDLTRALVATLYAKLSPEEKREVKELLGG